MNFTEKGIMSFAGSIRGAIAFGLAISIETKNQKIKEVLVSSTLVLVFVTTIIFGGLMPFVLKFLKSFLPKDDENKKPLISHDDVHGYDANEEKNRFVEFSHPNFQKV
jgi:NhaP-type Na+/H+ or K+/H+ antiporter